jgi:pimeloyl-ACP methyl ester carboxylesterase
MSQENNATRTRQPEMGGKEGDGMSTGETRDGWDLHIFGPAEADHTVLLLPGAMCTAAFFDDLVKEPKLSAASIRFVAATVPGFGDTRPLEDPTMENATRLAGRLASDLGCDAVVGHSVGGNLALEMVATGEFSGPVALLEPAFSREDEFRELAILDRIGRVPGVGHLAWVASVKTIGMAMKGELPPERHDALVAEMKQSDPRFCRRMVRSYFDYLDHHGSLVARLCDSGVKATVVFCDRSKVGLTDEERSGLEACPNVSLVDVEDSGHMVMTDQPARTAELILKLVSADAGH